MSNKYNEKKLVDYYIPERLEGIDAIRKAIDPTMSKSTFYRHHRKELDYILIERSYWLRLRPRACRYFTFREFLYHYVIDKDLL